jgi:mRNA interferase MazF
MPTFDRGDVVKAPFPYADAMTIGRRPALVIAATGPETADGGRLLVWVLMITSAENRPWPDDAPITDLAAAGLPAPSVVRCAKIATLDAARVERIGRLDDEGLRAVMGRVGAMLGRLAP